MLRQLKLTCARKRLSFFAAKEKFMKNLVRRYDVPSPRAIRPRGRCG